MPRGYFLRFDLTAFSSVISYFSLLHLSLCHIFIALTSTINNKCLPYSEIRAIEPLWKAIPKQLRLCAQLQWQWALSTANLSYCSNCHLFP